jgi:hypothetical protein
MSIVLPGELSWVLNMLGFQWPNVDEDKFREMAGDFRDLAGSVDSAAARHESAAQLLTSSNAGEAIDAFAAHSGHTQLNLGHLKNAAGIVADILDGLAIAVEVAKAAVIAQLVALAAEIAAAAAASVVTFGLSNAADLAATAATRITVRAILDELEQQVKNYLKQVVENTVFSALEGFIANAVQQGLGDYIGTSSGFSVSSAAKAGLAAGVSSVEDTAQSWTTPGGIAQNLAGMGAGAIQSHRHGSGGAEGEGGGEGEGSGGGAQNAGSANEPVGAGA